MIIRPETKEDFGQIYDLVKTAFQTAKVADGDEQDFVNRLRAGGNYIPELALVAEKNDRLIGHIMLTKTCVINENSTDKDYKFEALLLAPLAVLLEHRDQGVGSRLVNASMALAKDLGHSAVFLVGDPAYYHRFGFKPTAPYGIRPKSDIPEQYVMVHELVPDALNGVNGTVDAF